MPFFKTHLNKIKEMVEKDEVTDADIDDAIEAISKHITSMTRKERDAQSSFMRLTSTAAEYVDWLTNSYDFMVKAKEEKNPKSRRFFLDTVKKNLEAAIENGEKTLTEAREVIKILEAEERAIK